MLNLALLKDAKISYPVTAQVAGTADVSGSAAALDMAGFDAVMFIALLGTVTDNSVLSLQCRESDNANGSSDQVSAGSKTTDVTAATSSGTTLISDVVKPAKRYVFPLLKRGTQNAVVNGIIAIQYRARTEPTVQPTSVLASVLAYNG